MKLTKICGICVVMIGMLVLSPLRAQDTQAPDVMVKNLVEQTIKALKEDPAFQGDSNPDDKVVTDFVRTNIRPHVDAELPPSITKKLSSCAATEQQRETVSRKYSDTMALVIFTILNLCKDDCKIQVLPLRAQPSDTKAVVQTTLQLPDTDSKSTANMNYSLIKADVGWIISDIDISGGGSLEWFSMPVAAQALGYQVIEDYCVGRKASEIPQ